MTQSQTQEHGHIPVMRERILELVGHHIDNAGDNAVIIDATLGAGGHSHSMLETFPHAYVIGLDRDSAALEGARKRLAHFGSRFLGIHTPFHYMKDEIAANQEPACQALRANGGACGVLFDLGVSSMQLDQAERGFAYSVDAPLDMRMDQTTGITAADILNTYSHGEIARVIKEYGDERFAGKIASEIVKTREKTPFTHSGQLVELIYSTIPAPARRTGGHPAKRTFQGLRVEVNKELDSIQQALPQAAELVCPGGRVVVMSYQSLEDRMTKKFFTTLIRSTTPPGLPVDLPGTAAPFHAVTRGSEKASKQEIDDNPRAASVRVRAVEKNSPGGRR